MCGRTVLCLRRAAASTGASFRLLVTGREPEEFSAWLGTDLDCRVQSGADLGERISGCVKDAERERYGAIVIVGADSPDLDEAAVNASFELLQISDIVIGPALDGGIYLLALKSSLPGLFDGVHWGTDSVRTTLLANAARMRLKALSLPPLRDVDTPQDLVVWDQVLAREAESRESARMSVVIPALNEAACLGSCLAAAGREKQVEIIVADGGSHDNTAAIAEAYGVRVIHAAAGRARQMNAGAAIARGDILLFLHADTLLPNGYARQAFASMNDPRNAAGAFSLSLFPASLAHGVIAAGANFRSRRLQIPFGDQAIFLRRKTFETLGGYQDIASMEDLDLMGRLRRLGRIDIADQKAATSARRWERSGLLRTSASNFLFTALFLLGVPVRVLSRFRGP